MAPEDVGASSEALGVIVHPISVPSVSVDTFSPAGPQAYANVQVNVTVSELGLPTNGIVEGDVDGDALGGSSAVSLAGGQSAHFALTAYGWSLSPGAHTVNVRYKVQTGQVYQPSGHFVPIYTVLASASKQLAIGPYVGWPRFDQVYRTSTHNSSG